MHKTSMPCFAFALSCSVALPGAALAQVGNPVGAQVEVAPGTGTTQASADAQSPVADGDIIVTAQRRSERLRDVPISITALSQETLIKSGISSTLDIQRVTPGVQLPLYGGFLQPSIRGISSAGAGLGDSSNVAVYIDGVYQPSQSGQLTDLPDVQQIEILKGPQGTLYGQNAAGGAIIITSVTPSFTLGGRASASYGNYDDKAARGYITGPLIGDTVAASLAVGYEDRDGYRRNVIAGGRDSGLNSVLVRGRLLVKPTDKLQFIVGGYYSRRSDGTAYSGAPLGRGTPLGYALAGLAGLTIPKASGSQSFALNVDPLNRITTYGLNLIGTLDTTIGTLNSTTAYGNVKVRNVADADYTAVNVGAIDLNIANENFVQELNFTSNKFAGFIVSAGLFYLALKESYTPNSFFGYFAGLTSPVTAYPTTPAPLFTFNTLAFNRKRSYAAYAEIGYDITDRVNLTVGGRYSYETQRTADNHSNLLGPDVTALIPDPRGTVSFERFTPRAALRFAVTPTSNVYVSYSQGFKSGYVNSNDSPFVTPPLAPVQPEKVFAYEVGYKGRLARGVNLNVAAFRYDYQDLQVYTYSPPTEFYRNAASARINGIDGDISINAGAGLTLTAGAAYLDAKYRSFPNAVVYQPNAFGFGYDVTAADVSGRRLQRAPKLSGNVSINYEVQTGAGKASAYVAGTYNSGIKYDPFGIVQQRSYALLDSEISFAPDGIKGLRIVAYGRNLTNKAYLASVLETQFVLGGSYAAPRTYGVRAEFAF